MNIPEAALEHSSQLEIGNVYYCVKNIEQIIFTDSFKVLGSVMKWSDHKDFSKSDPVKQPYADLLVFDVEWLRSDGTPLRQDVTFVGFYNLEQSIDSRHAGFYLFEDKISAIEYYYGLLETINEEAAKAEAVCADHD